MKSGPVNSDNPEDTYDAFAEIRHRSGGTGRSQKLDPVIGRDTEIRNGGAYFVPEDQEQSGAHR